MAVVIGSILASAWRRKQARNRTSTGHLLPAADGPRRDVEELRKLLGRSTRSELAAGLVEAGTDGPGIEGPGDVAVWAVNDLNGHGLIYAVGGMAHQFSQWGHGENTDAAMSIFDDGWARAEACAGG